MLTDADRTYLREVDARERAAIKAFTTGDGTVEMAAKALSDVLRLREIIDRLAGERVHAYWIHGQHNNGKTYCYCSECSENALYDSSGFREFSDHCPHCGVKMDGERRKEPDDG
jgi:phage terminase large subunit GpA-like protein